MKHALITKASPDDADYVVGQLRTRSLEELELAGDPRKNIREAIERADMAWIGTLDGEIVCLWGVQSQSLIGGTAYLWVVTTNLVEENKFLFVRKSQMFVRELMKEYSLVHGYVDANFDRSIAWLTWLGFKISPPHAANPRLRYFQMGRN